MALENLSDPELSYLAVDLKNKYALIIKGVRVDVLSVIEDLFEVDEETHCTAREILIEWMYGIADAQEYKDPEETYRPMGYRGSWQKDEE